MSEFFCKHLIAIGSLSIAITLSKCFANWIETLPEPQNPSTAVLALGKERLIKSEIELERNRS